MERFIVALVAASLLAIFGLFGVTILIISGVVTSEWLVIAGLPAGAAIGSFLTTWLLYDRGF